MPEELTALQMCRRNLKLNQLCLRQYLPITASPVDATATRYSDSQPDQNLESRSCRGNQLADVAMKTVGPYAPTRRKSHHRRAGDIEPLCRQ